MKNFAEYVSKELGIRLPEEYAAFMETYGKKLSLDPVHKESWVGGLGTPDFVMGTTLAFRSSLPNFRKQNIVIGYIGSKTIIVNKTYEEVDEYLVLDTTDGSLLAVDSLGAANKFAAKFEEWISPELLRASLKEKYTSNLTVIVFDDESKAEEARKKLLNLKKQGFIELEDAVVVVKEKDGTARCDQLHRPARKGGLAGSVTGFIVGSLFFMPLMGAVVGGVAGAFTADLYDFGIDDAFIVALSKKFEPGCSALFTLIRKADFEKVREAFLGFRGKVLVNSLSKEREAVIQEILDAAEGSDD